MAGTNITQKEIKESLLRKAETAFGLAFRDLTKVQKYKTVCSVVDDFLTEKRLGFKKRRATQRSKQIYYMSMEFLLGRSLKNHLFNLDLTSKFQKTLKELDTDLAELYEEEPDAGLGNGGLGRLAAAYMESLTNLDYSASGFCIKYDFGIFKQKIVNGWQTELPDDWLPNGSVWLNPRVDQRYEVKFGGELIETWENGKLKINYINPYIVYALPYDMNISGYKANTVNRLRLWDAEPENQFDMGLFSTGQHVKALENKVMAEALTKVLYPADHHIEGKSLRLRQQYFFVSASIQSIISTHLKRYKTLDNLHQKIAIHINDTHPALCVPELMRILMDEHGFDWDKAWEITIKTIAYTNHTVMSEALEKWPQDLFKKILPRIYQIVEELNKRLCTELWQTYRDDAQKVNDNAILANGEIRMANICIYASYAVNGVSRLHSDILKDDVFADFYKVYPNKFTNVTNGITYRRWLCQSNPRLTKLIESLIGDGFKEKATDLEKLLDFHGDKKVLKSLAKIKRQNKEDLSNYLYKETGTLLNPDAIFDTQIKRLHEYKRQLLNVLHIIDTYNYIKENKNANFVPKVYIFGAKAAPSYYMAKQIIKLICMVAEMVNKDPDMKDKLQVIFVENYRITLSERIIPASEISEQISVAGKEASGTGNMKFMLNGAVTLGTMDGANVEISQLVGDENIFIFGLKADEVKQKYIEGYDPLIYFNNNPRLQKVIQQLRTGINGVQFNEIADSLLFGGHFNQADPYMLIADYQSYADAHKNIIRKYKDADAFNNMCLVNIAKSGFFSSDRSIDEYAKKIWRLKPVKK